MACLLTQSLGADCEFVVGGLSRLLLINKADITSASYSAITLTTTAKTAYEVTFAPGTGGFTNELTVSNGQKYVTQGIVFNVNSKSQEVLDEASNLALGKFAALCQDRAGDWYLLGRVGYGLQASVVALNSGVAAGDIGGLQVNMSNECTEYAVLYTGSLPSIAA